MASIRGAKRRRGRNDKARPRFIVFEWAIEGFTCGVLRIIRRRPDVNLGPHAYQAPREAPETCAEESTARVGDAGSPYRYGRRAGRRVKITKSALPLCVMIGATAGSATGTALTTPSVHPGWRRLTRATVPCE